MGEARVSVEPEEKEAADPAVEVFIARWQGREGGQERANYALFLIELCETLGLPPPDPAGSSAGNNNYVFERAVTFREAGDRIGHGRIDLYKRGAFVLEAKQSRQHDLDKAVLGQVELFDPAAQAERRGRRGAARGWDVLMLNARRQAEDYARALPSDHEWPPFILVCDVGHCIEVFADFTGRGRNYSQFPDRQGFRIYLEDLRRSHVRDRLRNIWLEPHALDPTRRAAEATRAIAQRLAEVSKSLEARGFQAEQVALFLMRCLFSMFAEDVRLLPTDSFTELLDRSRRRPENFPRLVGQLWEAMNTGGFAYGIEADVRRFNGRLFESATVLPLAREEIGELFEAARANWREVEPAIFGTLLEQALDPAERRRLGAHYTPRAYVERLVVATIIEPLRKDWETVLSTAERLNQDGDTAGAARLVRDFHEQLCRTRVLDPAAGTGNFLYVSMELMKRLEGEVLEALGDLGGQEALTGLEGHTVDPHQFLGLEINPRAAAIAELVLWIGYLQWHFRTRGEAPSEPILRAFGNIRVADAVLDWDGAPVPKIVDGRDTYPNAKRPEWPTAEFIVGNPPFIAGQNFREQLGDGFTEAIWGVYEWMPGGADIVMYWWDHAADLIVQKGTSLRRFGFVTTNSITQAFNRRVVARHLNRKNPVSLILAIPNHPWSKSGRESAAVRIAMTVATAGKNSGAIREVTREQNLESDNPQIFFRESVGKVNSDLSIGTDVTKSARLLSNSGMCSDGVKLHGAGFIVTRSEAELLGLGHRDGLEQHIKPYRNGRDLAGRSRELMVIDLFGLDEGTVRTLFPEVYQHLYSHVRPERQKNRRSVYREYWWIFGEPRREIRSAIELNGRYIVTVDTARHRVFHFLNSEFICDDKVVLFAFDDAMILGILSSRIHTIWSLAQKTRLGQGNDPVYVKSLCFDPFPFPVISQLNLAPMRALAEELDATRKTALSENPDLTLTGLYNALEKLRQDTPLDDNDRGVVTRGRVLILKELHERIDAAVFRAYGWPDTLTDAEIIERLVALNRERADEEKRGVVRWLRPDFQIPRFGKSAGKAEQIEADLTAPKAATTKPGFPAGDVEQTAAVFAALAAATAPLSAADIAAGFRQPRRAEPRIAAALGALHRLGHVSRSHDGQKFALRRVA